jgi:hypothetical protein
VLLEPTRIAYESALPGFGDRPTARFVTATLGNDAGLVGVADLAGSGRASGRSEGTADVLLVHEVHRDRTDRQGDLPAVDRGPHEHPVVGAAILASNHLSVSDSIFLPLMIDRPMSFLAKSDYFTGRASKAGRRGCS